MKVSYQEKFGFTFSSLGRLVSHYTWQQGIQTASHKCPWLFQPPHCKPIGINERIRWFVGFQDET